MIVQNILRPAFIGNPNCDTRRRSNQPGSFEFVRTFQVCRLVLDTTPNVADNFGRVIVKGIKVVRGPEGIYYYKYTTPNHVYSDPYSAYVGTDASQVLILTPPPAYARYGENISPQPIIQVTDSNKNPLSGKYVVAMAGMEWGIDQVPTNNDLQGTNNTVITIII